MEVGGTEGSSVLSSQYWSKSKTTLKKSNLIKKINIHFKRQAIKTPTK